MFYYLEGKISITAPNIAVVDVGGVGFGCYVTTNTLSRLEDGKTARLYTYCYIKEDAFDIFGFYDTNEKRCFEMLISVSGVGPKAALSILSVTTPDQLALAIITDNEKALTSASGIGKRIAQRIILELKDKIAKENKTISSGSAGLPIDLGMPAGVISEAMAALAVLGFSQQEISSLLKTIDTDNMTVEEIVKEALKSSLK